MKISTKGRYGLRAMLALIRDDDELVSLSTIAQKESLSLNYLESIFSQMKRADLVIGVTGAQGGYRLTRRADQISVYEVLRALEGSLSVTEPETSMPPIRQYLTDHVWNVIDGKVEKILRSMSILVIGVFINFISRRNIQLAERAYCTFTAIHAVGGKLFEHFVRLNTNSLQFRETGWHAEGTEKAYRQHNARFRFFLCFAVPNAPNFFRIACKTLRCTGHYVICPRVPHSGKAGTMRNVKHSAELMPKLMD